MYKFETHLHTSGCSACAVSTGCEMVDAAKEKGYSGFVITNHFYRGNTSIDRNLPWVDFVRAYKEDYEITKNYGAKMGIQVFFGFEEGFAPGKEMLVFGTNPDDIMKHPEFPTLELPEKVNLIHSLGGITVCAHPFRNRSYIPDPDTEPNPDLFDGIETYNKANPEPENEKAFLFAKKNGHIMLSGGDVHSAKAFGGAGIEFKDKILDYNDFLRKIKNNEFSLILE